MNKKTLDMSYAAIIAALYVVFTMIANAAGLANGVIQVRISEALTILPVFTWAAVPGLTVGCLLANLMTGGAVWDVIFGALATLLGALGTHYLARKRPWLGPVFPIASNTLIIPVILQQVYQMPGSYWYFAVTVGVGEIISCGVLGLVLHRLLARTRIFH